MTPTEFELLAQRLFAEKLKNEFGYAIPVEHQRTFKSLSGNTYNIDLSYTFKVFDINYHTLVECKYWNSSVTREKVGYFKSILDDIKAHKGILVTTKGFQKGAITYAQSQNIGLVKITNDRYFETYSHFDGAINLLGEKINKGKAFNPLESYTSIGLFTPQITVQQFIATHYGKDLTDFLEKDFDPGSLDDDKIEMSSLVRNQLRRIPDIWYKEYERYETAGLNYKLKNEPEIRILNLSIFLLKWHLKETILPR